MLKTKEASHTSWFVSIISYKSYKNNSPEKMFDVLTVKWANLFFFSHQQYQPELIASFRLVGESYKLLPISTSQSYTNGKQKLYFLGLK